MLVSEPNLSIRDDNARSTLMCLYVCVCVCSLVCYTSEETIPVIKFARLVQKDPLVGHTDEFRITLNIIDADKN